MAVDRMVGAIESLSGLILARTRRPACRQLMRQAGACLVFEAAAAQKFAQQ